VPVWQAYSIPFLTDNQEFHRFRDGVDSDQVGRCKHQSMRS